MKNNTKVAPKGAKAAAKKSSPKSKSDSSMVKGFKKLFIDELKDIYWAEKALAKAFPKMISKITSDDLIDAFEDHVAETEQQLTRLEEVFSALGVKAEAKKCEAMVGLIKESEQIIDETEEGPVRDAGIISAVQKIKHYEIATYCTLRSFATALSEVEAESLLEDILNEEKDMDEKLSELAESLINVEAMDMQEQD
jgi:ferritin-like metal-binding protein YciE